MPEYMDYGVIGNDEEQFVPVSTIRHSQVYLATHDGVGNRLPLMDRSFISFSYGGKFIEDFNLIATISGDRLQKNLYADFKDNTTTTDIWDGQFYWSTHYGANQLSFTLSTDGITEKDLHEFLMWFKPGIEKELILAERPNRAILARVSSPPEMSMLPFEEKITKKIADQEYTTSTTLYKGDIQLQFVMDNPFWYSKINLFKERDEDIWGDAYYLDSITFKTKDVIKICQEDDTPLWSMVDQIGEHPTILFGTESAVGGVRVGNSYVNVSYNVDITGDSSISIDPLEEDGVSSAEEGTAYFYYSGTAPCRPILKFTIVPTIDSSSYLGIPKNSFLTNEDQPFNIIAVQGKTRQYFTFTTPSIYTGLNQAIKVFLTYQGSSWEDIRATLRDTVKHWAPRAYAMKVIEKNKGTSTMAGNDALVGCVNDMHLFLKDNSGDTNDTFPAHFIFNGETGEAIGIFTYRTSPFEADYEEMTITENVGDMVKSKYLQIQDKNYPDANGHIQKWDVNHPEYGYRIYSDCPLTEFNILYKYLYL